MNRINYLKPKSICTCGHNGEGQGSEHEDRYAPGHGKCRRCECKMFTWKMFTPAYRKYLERRGLGRIR